MFFSFSQLKAFVLTLPFPLSNESLGHLLDLFQGKREAVSAFLHSLDYPLSPPESLRKVIGRGGYGVVYDDEYGNAVKFYREKHSYWIDEDSEAIRAFVENIMFYVLFKALLTKAYLDGFTEENLADSILTIDEIFAGKGKYGYIIGYTSKLYTNKWDEKYALEVYNLIEGFHTLADYGVFLTHGDLTTNNIIIDDNHKPLLIDFDIASVALEFYNPITWSPHGALVAKKHKAAKEEDKVLTNAALNAALDAEDPTDTSSPSVVLQPHLTTPLPPTKDIQYTSDIILSMSNGVKPMDFVLIDLVIFGCRSGIMEDSFEKLEKVFGKFEYGKKSWYAVAYNNFVATPIEFYDVMNVLRA